MAKTENCLVWYDLYESRRCQSVTKPNGLLRTFGFLKSMEFIIWILFYIECSEIRDFL